MRISHGRVVTFEHSKNQLITIFTYEIAYVQQPSQIENV